MKNCVGTDGCQFTDSLWKIKHERDVEALDDNPDVIVLPGKCGIGYALK